MSVTLDLDEQALASLPFGPGDRERHMQIELACRFCASGWLTLGMGARMAGLDQFAFGVALAERGIPPIRTHRGPGRPRSCSSSVTPNADAKRPGTADSWWPVCPAN